MKASRYEVPEREGGHVVVLCWNEVALSTALAALKREYPSGYESMLGEVRTSLMRPRFVADAIRTLAEGGH